MPITLYPLDGVDYSAKDAGLFHCTRTSGVYAGDDFDVTLTGADNTITVGPGIAWLRITKFWGVVAGMKEDTAVDMGIPDATYPRIDALVLRYDANKNGGELVAKKGTAASAPQPPERTQTEACQELHLYHVYRKPGAAAITAADVTDMRLNEAYCGLMADAVTRVDTSAMEAQLYALISDLQAGTACVLKTGSTMTGPLTIPTPTASGHAVNKGYVDTKTVSATLSASGWSDTAPYSQSVTVAGLTDARRGHAHPVYSGTLETDLAIKQACACVSYAKRSGTTVTFYCLEEKPSANIPIEVEVGV